MTPRDPVPPIDPDTPRPDPDLPPGEPPEPPKPGDPIPLDEGTGLVDPRKLMPGPDT